MARIRTSGPRRRMPPARPAPGARRIDRLAEIVDQCTDAKTTADELGDRFLAYLLAMAIQETRNAMRVEIKAPSTVARSAKAETTPRS